MRSSQARRARQPSIDVLEPGKGKALLHVLADGRSTGHFRLSDRQLDEVPEVWQGAAASDQGDGRWWETVDTMALDLSYNNIRSIPEQIINLSETLVTLNISLVQHAKAAWRDQYAYSSFLGPRHNPLQELPDHLGSLQQLKVLDVSSMKLAHLPEEIAALQNLVKLFCQGNALSFLPERLGMLQRRLQYIDCSSNKLQELPSGLGAASGLLSLNSSHNTLTSLEPALPSAWSRLTSLDISHNSFLALPDAVSSLNSLTALDASYNSLEGLPEGISQCTALVELFCSKNSIASIPDCMSKLQALLTLDLRANRLTCFPEAACELKLALLDLADNELASLPPQLGLMTTLRALPLSGNPLRGLRSTQPVASTLRTLRNRLNGASQSAASHQLQASSDVRIPEGSMSIDLKGKALQQVPDQVWASAAAVQKLDLSDNALCSLSPSHLTECTALQVLELSSNAFTEWPLPQASLPSIRQLSLASNGRLLSAPQNAMQCCAGTLQSLDLSGTPAAACVDVSSLPQLRSLRMARCGLTQMPGGVYARIGLRHLDVSGNSIMQVHDDISRLNALEELNLMNNNISALPAKLGLLSEKLRVLMLEGNPLRSIRRPILEKGSTAVLEYLRGRIPSS